MYGLWCGERRRVSVPVCVGCADHLFVARAAWVALAFALGVAGSVALAIAADALVVIVPALRDVVVVGVLAAALIAVAVPVLALRRGMRAFHRRLGPVWVVRAEERPSTKVVLGARRAFLVDGTGPRLPSAGLPPAAWVAFAALVGAVLIALGLVEYRMLGAARDRGEAVTRHWLEIALVEAGGPGAVLGLFVGMALVVLGVGVGAAFRARRERRQTAASCAGPVPVPDGSGAL